MPSLGNLFFKIGADTSQAASSLKRLEDQINSSVKNVGSIGKLVGGALSAAGILEIGRQALIASAQFETAFLRIKNLTGATTKDLERYKSSLKGISSEVGQPIAKLTAGLYTITSAGLNGAAALETLSIAAKATAVGMGDTETIARTISATLNAYGKENISAAKAANVLFNTTKLGALDIAELAPAMSSVIGVAATLGIKFEQLGGFVSALSLQGINASEAVTSLRSIIDAMIKPSEEAEKALAGVGLSMEKIRNIAKTDLSLALRTVSEAFNGNETAIAKVLGRKEAVTGFFAVTGQNMQRYSEILNQVTTDTTSFDKATKEALDSTEARWNKITASAANFALGLGDIVKKLIVGALTYSSYADEAGNIAKISETIRKNLNDAFDNQGRFDENGLPLIRELGEEYKKTKKIIDTTNNSGGGTTGDGEKKQLTVLQQLNEQRDKLINKIQEAGLAHRTYTEEVKKLAEVEAKIGLAEQARADALDKISKKIQASTIPQKTIKEVESNSPIVGNRLEGKLTGLGDLVQQDEQASDLTKTLEGLEDVFVGIGNASAEAFGQVVANLLSGKIAFKDLGKAALSAARDIVQASLASAIASVIKWAVSKLGPLGVGIAIAGVALISGLFKSKVPKLAKGGLAFGPQLALVGDNPNAGRDPEVIAPLSRLQGLLRTEVFKMTDVLSTAFNQSLAAVQFNQPISPSLLQNIELRPQQNEINVVGRIDGTDIMLVVDRNTAFKKRRNG